MSLTDEERDILVKLEYEKGLFLEQAERIVAHSKPYHADELSALVIPTD